jgi:hypothetical protein
MGMINSKYLLIISIIAILLIALFFTLFYNNEKVITVNSDPTMHSILTEYFEAHTIKIDTDLEYFEVFFTQRDLNRLEQKLPVPVDGMWLEFKKEHLKVAESLKPNDSTVVIYPIFTSATYKEPGFYTYFRGECDESCIVDLSFENPEIKYTSSGMTTQILYLLGYEFVTDIDVDKNPQILKNYDTVIVLHNEYVTKKMFDAISTHPNLIYLFPNALYAEIDVNYNDNTLTLIRGHQYPTTSIANGFDYEIEERFHDYEYDAECLDWEFIEFENGFHLNCYPDGIIFNKFINIFSKMKEL